MYIVHKDSLTNYHGPQLKTHAIHNMSKPNISFTCTNKGTHPIYEPVHQVNNNRTMTNIGFKVKKPIIQDLSPFVHQLLYHTRQNKVIDLWL